MMGVVLGAVQSHNPPLLGALAQYVAPVFHDVWVFRGNLSSDLLVCVSDWVPDFIVVGDGIEGERKQVVHGEIQIRCGGATKIYAPSQHCIRFGWR